MSESTESVTNNTERSRFELTRGGETAFLAYEESPAELTLAHTEVPVAMRGLHAGETLVKAALEHARQQHLRVVAVCPFVRAYLRKHPYGW